MLTEPIYINYSLIPFLVLKPDSGMVQTHISDHYLIYVVLNLKVLKPLPIYVISRSYKNYDSESFVNDLAQGP